MKFEPRQYQQECATAWYEDIKKDDCRPIIAVPTGAGKSVIVGMVIEKYLKDHPHNHVVILSHTQEILVQDHAALKVFFPDMHIGVYSAGLKSKEIKQVTVAGIQSVIKAKDKFKWTNLYIVDEVHSVNHKEEGSYRKLFAGNRAVIAGMSATIFRTGHGYIHKGKHRLFTKLSYDLTSTVNFNKLVKDGYLCDLISVAPKTQLDSTEVKKSAGDYNIKDLANEHDKESITRKAIQDAVHYGRNYKKWLVFAIDIDHCQHISDELNHNGIKSSVLHSRMDADRETVINDFKAGRIRALVSVGMVSTGFDVPDIDLILMLRPTMSTVLHVQMTGRGLRVAPLKKHCLILDYAGNTARLGPINNPIIPKSKESEGGGEAPTKTCPVCSTITYTLAKMCESCGHEFIFKTKLTGSASDADIMDRGGPVEKWMKVTRVNYSIHKKAGKPDSLKVAYLCGLKTVTEYVCVEHSNYAGYKALHWLKFRGYKGYPNTRTVFDRSNSLSKPSELLVDFSSKYPEIKETRF